MSYSDSITIQNTIDSFTCIISSSSGSTFVDSSGSTVLLCRLFNTDGEIDELNDTVGHEYEYYYLWKRDGADWRVDANEESIAATGKILEIDPATDLGQANSYVFSCSVFRVDEYNAYLNNNGDEPLLIAYNEINLDLTIKKWMRFDEETGLWVYGSGDSTSDYATLTENGGFHIYKKNTEVAEVPYAEQARFSTSCMIKNLVIGQLMAKPTKNGWIWSTQFEDCTLNKINEDLITELITVEEYLSPAVVKVYNLAITITNANLIFDDTNNILEYNYSITDENGASPPAGAAFRIGISIDDYNTEYNDAESNDNHSLVITSDYSNNNISFDLSRVNNLSNGTHSIIFSLYNNNNDNRYEYKEFNITTDFINSSSDGEDDND